MMRLPSLDAAMLRVPVPWRALLAVLILCGAIGAMVESRARILRSGTEIRLKTAPVDPRDLFRGDYVVLNYDISTVDAGPAAEPSFKRGETVHVRLVRDAEGFAQAAGVSRDRPAASGADTIIAGRVLSTGACPRNDNGEADCARGGRSGLRIAYGLESYFVPQGSGRAIERTDRKRIEVVAAVSASGEAAIKRLLIDGKLVHAEPPY